MSETTQMPIIILPKGELSPEDLERLRTNGLCVVEADNPDAVRFMAPPPADYAAIDRAAIEMVRRILAEPNWSTNWDRRTLGDWLARIMVRNEHESTAVAPVKPVKKSRKS